MTSKSGYQKKQKTMLINLKYKCFFSVKIICVHLYSAQFKYHMQLFIQCRCLLIRQHYRERDSVNCEPNIAVLMCADTNSCGTDWQRIQMWSAVFLEVGKLAGCACASCCWKYLHRLRKWSQSGALNIVCILPSNYIQHNHNVSVLEGTK